uniref:Uncharacterized protein n=1 Tax=Arundo donax TaxID=35708 RepID=A0A0A9A8J2_ARUDO
MVVMVPEVLRRDIVLMLFLCREKKLHYSGPRNYG